MKRKIILLIAFIAFSIKCLAFEVNTHQAITRCATQTIEGLQLNQCGQKGSINLHKFAEDALLADKDYTTEMFADYGYTYKKYAETGEGFTKWKIIIPDGSYSKMIEAGVVLEDSVYSHRLSDEKVKGGEGRFNNHFYSTQFTLTDKECDDKIPSSTKKAGRHYNLEIKASDRLTPRALCNGATNRTDNISWALDKDVVLHDTNKRGSVTRTNNYNLDHAFNYYRASFLGTEEFRKASQAKLFVSLGFMIHMIQDLHSPAHVRDGSHAGGDYLEIYGRYNGGFNLRNGNFNSNNNPLITQAIQNINMKQLMLVDNKYSSYEDFFKHEANWISNNFMSEAHDFDFSENGKLSFTTDDTGNPTGEGLELDEDEFGEKFTTIFDKYNSHLVESEVREESIPNSSNTANSDDSTSKGNWFYLKTKGNVSEEKGVTINKVVALRYRGYFVELLGNNERNKESMAMVTDSLKSSNSYANYNKRALEDTAISVMPRAVVSSEAFINYFFRGRMKASLEYDPMLDEEFIKITNTSDAQWVSSPDLCTFKKGMKINIYYVDKNGESKSIRTSTLLNDVVIGESTVIPMANYISSITDMGDKKQIIVLLDGQLGTKADKNDYGIDDNGARGLVVAYASSRVANADILFSFDRSGSMGSDINNAKISAKDVLDDVVGVDNNTTYIEIEAFNSSVSILMPYENNVTKAKARIDTLYSGGGTALYDAIRRAGNNAVSHKASSGIAKSIVILYTDGQNTSSSGSKQQAIDAISVEKAGSIDEVFLIHVGNGGGASELKSIADQANRKYLKVDNATGLKDAISKILKGQ